MPISYNAAVTSIAEDDNMENDSKKPKVKKHRLKLRVYSQKDAIPGEELNFLTDGRWNVRHQRHC